MRADADSFELHTGCRRSRTGLRLRVAASVLALLAVIACGGPDPIAPTITSFAASPDVIEAGQMSTLSWQVVDAASLTLLPGGADVTGEKSWLVSPAVSTTYSLLAENAAGGVSREVEVVVRGAGTFGLTVAVTGEGTGTVTSEVGGIAVNSGDDAVTTIFDEGTTVTLTATAAAGSIFSRWTGGDCDGIGACEITLDADTTVTATFDATTDAPVISSFTAHPEQIPQGGSSTLSWNVLGATTLTLLPDDVDVTGHASWIVAPEVTTIYTLVATSSAGVREEAATVFVGDLPTIESFAPVGELVNPGLPITVAWLVADADSVTLEGPGLPVRDVGPVGSLEVMPPVPGATYLLRATNGVGPVEATAMASRAVPAFSVLIAGQSNAKGENVSASEAIGFITAAAGVEMLGNDYVWKVAYEPTGDCVGHVDLVSADPEGGCTAFDQNTSGVSSGVSLSNHIAAATGGEVFIVPAAKSGSALAGTNANDNWQPGSDRYDRATLFGSAAYRAQRSGIERGAPIGFTFDGAAYGAVLWYQGTSDTNRTMEAYFGLTDNVLAAFEEELGTQIILVQLSSRNSTSSTAVARNVLYQRIREVQRLMADGARTLTGDPATEARAGRHLVVTHDLPMSDIRHLSAESQVELGRRVSLAVREHLLGEKVDGTGPRLERVERISSSSPTVMRVILDREVTAPMSTGPGAYSGYFAAFSDGEEIAISKIELDSSRTSILIELSTDVAGAVEILYMPPAGAPSSIRLDVVRSASCADPIPYTSACLPLPAFGIDTSVSASRALQLMVDEADED